jgi:DNA-nicking Smr family endonuclease
MRKPSRKPAGPALRTRVDLEIDLHGLTIEVALNRVSALLKRSDLGGGKVIRLIHGHSNSSDDSIRVQLNRMLTGPWQPRLRDCYSEPKNPGSTLIVLEDA